MHRIDASRRTPSPMVRNLSNIIDARHPGWCAQLAVPRALPPAVGGDDCGGDGGRGDGYGGDGGDGAVAMATAVSAAALTAAALAAAMTTTVIVSATPMLTMAAAMAMVASAMAKLATATGISADTPALGSSPFSSMCKGEGASKRAELGPQRRQNLDPRCCRPGAR